MGNLHGFAVAVVEVGGVDAHLDLLLMDQRVFFVVEGRTWWLTFALRLCSESVEVGSRGESLLEVDCAAA